MKYDKEKMLTEYKGYCREGSINKLPFYSFTTFVGSSYVGFSFIIKRGFFKKLLFCKNSVREYEYRIRLSDKKIEKKKGVSHNKKLFEIALNEALKDELFAKKYYS